MQIIRQVLNEKVQLESLYSGDRVDSENLQHCNRTVDVSYLTNTIQVFCQKCSTATALLEVANDIPHALRFWWNYWLRCFRFVYSIWYSWSGCSHWSIRKIGRNPQCCIKLVYILPSPSHQNLFCCNLWWYFTLTPLTCLFLSWYKN